MSSDRPVLETRDLRVVRGGVEVLDISEFAVHEGEVVCVVGPNGAGKTTLLQALCCLLRPSRGEIVFRGQRIETEYPVLQYRRRVAMVFQEALLFDSTVYNNVASGLKLRGLHGSKVRESVEEQMERFGIAHLRDRSARKLSGGEAQRTSLARAFAIKPEIIFLDEPFASLDQPSRESLMDDLQRILKRTNTAAFFATHDRIEALRLANRIAVMDEGTILQVGTPAEVMNHPANEFVASFVGVETILHGIVIEQNGGSLVTVVSATRVEALGDANVGEHVLLCVRPENVVLATRRQDEGVSSRNVYQGQVKKVIPMGPYFKVQLDCGFPITSYVTAHSLEGMSIQEGKTLTASFKATAVHVIRNPQSMEQSLDQSINKGH
ncbi:MAG: tungsten transporter binding protein [Deltaproteobacteria bacterium]|nr:tungsten transporter binding protein [Deltaproteobacteria bacterium]